MSSASHIKIIDWLLSNRRSIDDREIETLAAFKLLYDTAAASWDDPADRAIIGGFVADRVSYSFAAGYESALRRLVPSLPPRAIVSFCVTEELGAHPASIRSTLRKAPPAATWSLNGSKKFITMADSADLILAAASTGTASDGKNMIRIALVARTDPGIEIAPMAGLPYIPEIHHGAVAFREVQVEDSDILPGDGYRDYIRPFRTIEDLYVFAAIGGHLFRIACRYGWPEPISERILSILVCARALALDDPSAPAVHIALGGLHAQIIALFEAIEPHWESVDVRISERWQRDRPLLVIAGKARERRLERAWSRYQ